MVHVSLASQQMLLFSQLLTSSMCCSRKRLNTDIAVQLSMPGHQLRKAARLTAGCLPRFSQFPAGHVCHSAVAGVWTVLIRGWVVVCMQLDLLEMVPPLLHSCSCMQQAPAQ